MRARPHRHPLRWRQVAMWTCELSLAAHLERSISAAEATTRTTVERAVGKRHVASAGLNRHGGVGHDAGRVVPAAHQVDVPTEARGPDGVRDLHRSSGVRHLVGRATIEIGRSETGISKRRARRLGGQRQCAPAGVPTVRGASDSDDDGLSAHAILLAPLGWRLPGSLPWWLTAARIVSLPRRAAVRGTRDARRR